MNNKCWRCLRTLTSANIHGICNQCRVDVYSESKYKKMWETLKFYIIANEPTIEMTMAEMMKIEKKIGRD